MTLVSERNGVELFQGMVGGAPRLGVSEFARSKGWRERLPEAGCMEVVDRGGTVGYVISPGCAKTISERIALLEEELERAQIEAMFSARSGRSETLSGDNLKDAAKRYLDDNLDSLMEAIDGD